MWKPSNREQFLACVSELIYHEDVQSMEQINQHREGITCLDHSICVAYVSFLICRKLGLDYTAAARGGLLHDLHLHDWDEENVGSFKRLVIHSQMAADNAEKFDINDLERDIILNHMWPVTPLKIPKRKESIVVNIADKICTIGEVFRLYQLKRIKANVNLVRESD